MLPVGDLVYVIMFSAQQTQSQCEVDSWSGSTSVTITCGVMSFLLSSISFRRRGCVGSFVIAGIVSSQCWMHKFENTV